jgi:CBS domain-containing protein
MSHDSTPVLDLMSTALITLKPDDTINIADMEMKFAVVRHIPIVDERNKLVGMVSNRDILRALGASDGHDVTMKTIMTKKLYTVNQDDPAFMASELILENKVGAIPVLGDDQQLVGLITETDFVRFAHEQLGGRGSWD